MGFCHCLAGQLLVDSLLNSSNPDWFQQPFCDVGPALQCDWLLELLCVDMAHWKQHAVFDHSAHLCPHEPSPLIHLLSVLFSHLSSYLFGIMISSIRHFSQQALSHLLWKLAAYPHYVQPLFFLITVTPVVWKHLISPAALFLSHKLIVCVSKVAAICYPMIVVYVPNVDRKCSVQALFHLYIVLYLFCSTFIDLWVQMCEMTG